MDSKPDAEYQGTNLRYSIQLVTWRGADVQSLEYVESIDDYTCSMGSSRPLRRAP